MSSHERNVWLQDFLSSIQLSSFYELFVNKLQVTELDHFDYVNSSDLKRIGLSSAAILRLVDALKRYRIEFNLPQSYGSLYSYKRGKHNPFYRLIHPQRENSSVFYTEYEPTMVRSALSFPTSQKPGNEVPKSALLISSDDIIFHDSLGHGTFGVVRRADWKLPCGKWLPVAVKVFKNLPESRNGASNLETILREIQTMHSLDHPNLIRLYGLLLNPPMIVTEFAPLGSLLAHLRARSYNSTASLSHSTFFIDALWNMGIQLASGMAYLSSRNIIHRDLAARNVLLCRASEAEFPLVKIGDFGLARGVFTGTENKSPSDITTDIYKCTSSQPVPIAWSSLEALESGEFSQASDVWSWGVTLWEIWTGGAEPWPHLSTDQLLVKLKSGQRLTYPGSSCPKSMYQLMLACWDSKCDARPSFAYLVKRLKVSQPIAYCALHNLDEADRLGVESGDIVIVFDHNPKNFWWRGQNKRTGEVGSLPRRILDISQNNNHQPLSSNIDQHVPAPIDNYSDSNQPIYEDLQSTYYESLDILISLNEDVPSVSAREEVSDPNDERNILKFSKDFESTIGRQRHFHALNKPTLSSKSERAYEAPEMRSSFESQKRRMPRQPRSDNGGVGIPAPTPCTRSCIFEDLPTKNSRSDEESLIDFDTEIPSSTSNLFSHQNSNLRFSFFQPRFPTPTAPIYESCFLGSQSRATNHFPPL
ncbi:tyrosine kinase, non-receptor [Cichlidogyrus casuarinus]|uniref:non-specific protein-tyrosine kinase n=1 Tax=Cichlidogyrus casuarinus TaxID=1844966 RepID=A0ABD2QC71_9PLAT